ncbi:MAG: hypothetical protein ACK56I_30675, partial [bacterium]
PHDHVLHLSTSMKVASSGLSLMWQKKLEVVLFQLQCENEAILCRLSREKFPHPHVQLMQSAAIPRAFESVSATMLHS